VTLPRPEAVVFDFDGVIADTERLHCDMFLKVLEPHRISFTWEEYIDRYMGCDDRDAFRKAFRLAGREDLDDRQLKKLVDAKSRQFLEAIRDGVQTYPGVISLIKTLPAAKDKPVDMKKLLAEIVGDYSFDFQGQTLMVQFTEQDGKLFGAPPGETPEEIKPVEGKPLGFDVTVSTNGEYYELQFVRNDKGVIDKCVMSVQGMVIEGFKVAK